MRRGYAPVICGKCNMPLNRHPIETCPYEYLPVRFKRRIVGYNMVRKK